MSFSGEGENASVDPGEADQSVDQRHTHPVVADQRPGVGEELVGHVDPVRGDPVLGEIALGVRDLLQGCLVEPHVVRVVCSARIAEDRRHPAVAVVLGDLDGMSADAIRLVEVDSARIGDRVSLVGPRDLAACLARHRELERVQVVDDDLGDGRLAGAELDVTEVVARGTEVADVEPFADHDEASAVGFELFQDVLAQLRQRGSRLAQIDLERHLAVRIGEPGRGGDEADLTSHRLDHEDRVSRGGTGVFLVGLADVLREVTRRGAVAGRVVEECELGITEVVVDRLGYAGRHQVEPPVAREQADLVRCVLRVVAADVEEIADVVGLEDINDALEIFVLSLLELVATGADAPRGGRGPQQGDLLVGRGREVDQLLLQHAFDAD